jgi:transcriptional regulator with XRE-family HTH domain
MNIKNVTSDLFVLYGKNLKNAREAAGLTQTELAERVESSQPTIARWEAGRGVPSDGMKIRLALVLGYEQPRDLFPLEVA